MPTASGYLSSLGAWGTWTPALTPGDVPSVPGFSLGSELVGQLHADAFLTEALRSVWAPLGAGVLDITAGAEGLRDSLIDSSTASAITQWGNRLAGGMATAFDSIEAVSRYAGYVTAWADFVLGKVTGTVVGNQNRKRDARAEMMRELQRLGPAAWAGGYQSSGYYQRYTGSAEPANCLAWKPTQPGWGNPLQYPNEVPSPPLSGDCKPSCSELACRGYSTGSLMLFPLFFPVWSNQAIGGAQQSLTRGMSETDDAGAEVWEICAAMQTALFTDPAVNVQLDARRVRERVEFARGKFVAYLEKAGQKKPDSAYIAGKTEGWYWTPAGQVGEYTVTGPRLVTGPGKGAVIRAGAPNCYGAEQHFPASDLNAIVGAAGQFFALRSAVVRNPAVLTKLRDKAPELLTPKNYRPPGEGIDLRYPVPEPELRALIANPPAQAGTIGGGTGSGSGGIGGIAQAPGAVKPPKFEPISEPKSPGISPLALVAGAVLGAWLLLK